MPKMMVKLKNKNKEFKKKTKFSCFSNKLAKLLVDFFKF